MAEKISPDVLVQTATQLYFSVKKNRADLIEQSGSIEERRRQEKVLSHFILNFVIS